jgi:hypothetical protein
MDQGRSHPIYAKWTSTESFLAGIAYITYPDLTRFNSVVLPVGKVPQNREVILDIDPDYFACRDSIQNETGYRLEVTKEQFAAKDEFLCDQTLRFSGMFFDSTEKDCRYFVQVSPMRGKIFLIWPREMRLLPRYAHL